VTLWADNETTTDLLGFAPWVDAVADLVTSADMLPLTVGVFSDWGGGKTSLMSMLRERLVSGDGYVVVDFQPWLHRNYDDVRGALMVAIVDALHAKIPVLEKAGGVVTDAAKTELKKFARRVDWLRVMKFGLKAGGALATMLHAPPVGFALGAGALSDLPHLLTDAPADGETEAGGGPGDGNLQGLLKPKEREGVIQQAAPPVERAISEFRKEFAELLEHLGITSLVVLVDDLDRCSPSTILDTLEAIKLFFAVPRTAFVICADQRIIRHALETRYPETGPLATTLGREYLEKIIQIPVRIPPLTPAELETYMYLLVVERHLGRGDDTTPFEKIRVEALARMRVGLGEAALNYGVIKELLGEVPERLQADLALVAQVAPVLAPQLKGNPRQAKRFLNLVFLRGRLASGLGITVDMPVLAKLAALEYFDEIAFSQIATWNAESPGASPHILALEAFANGTALPDSKDRDALERFAARFRLKDWLKSQPPIGNVDIGPYVTFAREKVLGFGARERALAPGLQDILVALLDDSAAVAASALERATTLGSDDQDLLFDALLGRLAIAEVTPAHVDAILGLIPAAPARASAFAAALQRVAPTVLPGDLPMTIRARIPASLGSFTELIATWAALAEPKMLARTAQRVISLETLKKKV
jgi:KAP-like P-loop domain-containing protein